jgi:hypothetical protein
MTHRIGAVVALAFAVLGPTSVVLSQKPAAEFKLLAAKGAAPDVGLKIFVASGSVRLVAWDHDSIVVRGRIAPAGRLFFGGRSRSSYKLGVEPRTPGGPDAPADLVIYVPRRAELSVKGVDASITAAGVGGWFYTVSGAIQLSGDAAHVEAESIRGDVALDVSAMQVKARTGRGHMVIRGSPEDVDASTVGGPLDIQTSTILRGRFGSVTGDIRYAAAPAPGGVFEFSNHAGTVDVLLPRATSTNLQLSSVTGTIQNGFSQVRPVSAGPHDLTVRLGAGEAHITVRSFKGAIRLLPR